MEGRHLPPSPSRYFFFFLASFFFFAIRKSPPFRCNRRLSPRLAGLLACGSSAPSRLERPLSPRLRASPFSSNCHACGILSALASAEPRLELRAPSRLERQRSTSATAAAPSSSPSCASLRSSSWLSSSWKRHLPSPPRSPWPPGGYGPLVHGHAAHSDRDRHRAGADTPRARRFSLWERGRRQDRRARAGAHYPRHHPVSAPAPPPPARDRPRDSSGWPGSGHWARRARRRNVA